MLPSEMMHKIENASGFVAAPDESRGSTPGALENYGIDRNAFDNETATFDLIHAMRERITRTPAFQGDRITGAILFEERWAGPLAGMSAPRFLWEQRGVVPFVEIDRGLQTDEGASNS